MLVHMDNFSLYGLGGETRMTEGVYANRFGTEVVADPDINAPLGSLAAKPTDFSFLYSGFRFVLPTPQAIVGAGWRWWVNNIPVGDNDRPGVTFSNAANIPIVSVTINTLGGLVLRTGNASGAAIATTEGPVVTASGWYHIEVKLDTLNGVEIRVEGRTVLTYANNFIAACQNVFFGMYSNNGSPRDCYYKDIVVWNGSGPNNNDFLGAVAVVNLSPTSDVALNWTPSTGTTGFAILDNIPPNDGQYIQANLPAPAPYRCGLSDLPLEITSVRAVMTVVRAAKVDGGDGSLQNAVVSAGVTTLGADRAINTSSTYWRDIFERDPATNAPWLPSAVNLATMQINRTT